MEPMLEPFEERSFAALATTAAPFVHRRSRRRRRRGWPEAPANRAPTTWQATRRRRSRR
jgi:hypothetical protein